MAACIVLTGEGCSSSDISADAGFLPDINTDLYNLPIPIDDSYDTSLITSLLSSEQVINDTGGGLALILVKDGKVVYRRGFGSFENDIDKVVPVASASKWISAGVVAKLMDAGNYDLNDLVTDYYPYFDGVTPAPLPAPDGFVHDDRMERMTIAQLFSHTAGLSYQPEVQRLHELSSIQSAVAQIYFYVPMDFEPGTFVQYAGVGMQIVGGVLRWWSRNPGRIFLWNSWRFP